MERRIAGIIRWLERCLSACRSGALESALMDAECARADLDRLRDEVWAALEEKHAVRARKHPVVVFVKAAGLALMVVLATATPVALFQEGRVWTEPAVSIEWVTPDERALLGNLRKHLSESNSLAAVARDGDLSEKNAGLRAASPVVGKAVRNVSAVSEEPSNGSNAGVPSYDRILTLLQAGEKALKNERPVIKIERN